METARVRTSRWRAGLAVLLASVVLVGCGQEDASSVDRDAADAELEAEESSGADVRLIKRRSYCQQDHIVGNVDVVVALKNAGVEDEEDISILPIREYVDGREVRPIGDTMVDIVATADGKVEPVWASYEVGPGNEIVACRIKIVGSDSFDPNEEISIKVRSGG